MPSRNIEKFYIPDTYYHLYNRGVNKRRIFLDEEDYSVFLNLLKRYLDTQPVKDKRGREYKWLYPELELLAFCLMSNHFHLLIYQYKSDSITSLVRPVATAYTMYFNKKYKRRGPLFESRYRASIINRDEYLQHISRYIHLNPEGYSKWEFSSLPYYLKNKKAGWVRPNRILDLFSSQNEYSNFVDDYVDYKKTLDSIKAELAN